MLDAKPVVLTVTQLNKYVKSILDDDCNLQLVFMVGEISNFTNHRTGHLYFTLKDEQSAIKAVMFRQNALRLKFVPQDSMRVIVRGRVSVYEASGQYQFYVDDMQPDGVGALAMQFEQLKEKLASEGIFDAEHKKTIPQYPEKVGIITSPTGAALQDMLNILNRRFKYSEVVFYPAQVQGDDAVPQIVEGIKLFNKLNAADVLIVGRGGGSIEDLWAFNSEELARAIYASKIPVISAVGHETDFTIADFAADLRAETPSAAAEYAVPDYDEQKNYINRLNNALFTCAKSVFSEKREQLKLLENSQYLKNPYKSIEYKQLKLDSLCESLNGFESRLLERKRLEFSACVSKLQALSPLNVLARGYSAAYYNGEIIKSKKQININDEINIKLSDGELKCLVKEIL
jgi:exodeoxyribonuclease VII large subunit